jgi:hypothetical protein
MIKSLFVVVAVSMLPGIAGAQTAPAPKDPVRQAKQVACQNEAKAKNITPDQRKAFMKECRSRP